MFTETLEEIRRERRMTQTQMAQFLHMSPRTYKDYVYGEREMSPALQNHVALTLRSSRLALLVLAEFDNPFSPLLLDVDDHPAMEFCVAVRELREAEEALLRIDAAKAAVSEVESAADQLMDLLHLIPIALTSWWRTYQIDPWACRARNVSKIQARGYLAKERVAA